GQQNSTAGHLIALLDGDTADRPVDADLELVLDLHRLQHHKHLTLADRLALRHANADDAAIHRGEQTAIAAFARSARRREREVNEAQSEGIDVEQQRLAIEQTLHAP